MNNLRSTPPLALRFVVLALTLALIVPPSALGLRAGMEEARTQLEAQWGIPPSARPAAGVEEQTTGPAIDQRLAHDYMRALMDEYVQALIEDQRSRQAYDGIDGTGYRERLARGESWMTEALAQQVSVTALQLRLARAALVGAVIRAKFSDENAALNAVERLFNAQASPLMFPGREREALQAVIRQASAAGAEEGIVMSVDQMVDKLAQVVEELAPPGSSEWIDLLFTNRGPATPLNVEIPFGGPESSADRSGDIRQVLAQIDVRKGWWLLRFAPGAQIPMGPEGPILDEARSYLRVEFRPETAEQALRRRRNPLRLWRVVNSLANRVGHGQPFDDALEELATDPGLREQDLDFNPDAVRRMFGIVKGQPLTGEQVAPLLNHLRVADTVFQEIAATIWKYPGTNVLTVSQVFDVLDDPEGAFRNHTLHTFDGIRDFIARALAFTGYAQTGMEEAVTTAEPRTVQAILDELARSSHGQSPVILSEETVTRQDLAPLVKALQETPRFRERIYLLPLESYDDEEQVILKIFDHGKVGHIIYICGERTDQGVKELLGWFSEAGLPHGLLLPQDLEPMLQTLLASLMGVPTAQVNLGTVRELTHAAGLEQYL